jgi:hypothetical protein
MSRELRIRLLVVALVFGSLETLIYAVQEPAAPAANMVPAAAPPAAADSAPWLVSANGSPHPACGFPTVGHYPQMGMQTIPIESPCD